MMAAPVVNVLGSGLLVRARWVSFPTPRDESRGTVIPFPQAAGFSARGGSAFGGNPRNGRASHQRRTTHGNIL